MAVVVVDGMAVWVATCSPTRPWGCDVDVMAVITAIAAGVAVVVGGLAILGVAKHCWALLDVGTAGCSCGVTYWGVPARCCCRWVAVSIAVYGLAGRVAGVTVL